MTWNKSFKLNKIIIISKNIFSVSLIASALLIIVIANTNSFAEPIEPQTEITPLNDFIGIEKSTLQMFIPNDNKLPWGFVEGKISNHVVGYPVIIQIFDSDETVVGNNIGAVRFAQTPVDDDGSYEYRFRILDSNQGQIKHIFDGNYTVKIFKVVYLNPNHEII
jgi:hypothetical protein